MTAPEAYIRLFVGLLMLVVGVFAVIDLSILTFTLFRWCRRKCKR